MNSLGENIPDEDLPLVPSQMCEIPAEVETRLLKRFVEFRGRIVARPHERSWESFIPTVHRLRWAMAFAGAAAAMIMLVVWLGRPSDAWAQVVEKTQSMPWIHAKGNLQGASYEWWLSAPRGIQAARIGKADYVSYASRESKVKLTYRSADGKLVRLPLMARDEESLRRMDTLFARAFRGAAGADLSTSSERLVKQRTSEVEVDGKRWLDYELTFALVDGDRERVIIYRVDPLTRLPKSSVQKPQFANDHEIRLEFDYPQSGPADIFALGVPRDAEVDDHVPEPELAKIMAGMRAGREKMDAYSGLIVASHTRYHWTDASTVWRFWRSGNKWRLEQSGPDVPGPTRRAFVSDDAPPRPAEDADQQTWWKTAAETIRFRPILVSDGKTSYRFTYKASPEAISSREDWDRLRYEIVSVAPDNISIPTADGGPSTHLLPEFVARPPLGIPSAGRQATVNVAPIQGPKGTILVSVSSTTSVRSAGQRVWVDPERGYMAIRQELETSYRNSQGNPQFQVRVIDEAAQSPGGVWYPRVMRSLTSGSQIGEEIGDRPAGITRFYLDFETPIPPEVFSTPVLKQAASRPGSTPSPHTRAQAVQRSRSMDHLSSIGIAMNSYEMEHHHFPSATIIGPDGKTPHSWRVAILPYLGHKELFDQYDLAEPWDSPNNLKVLVQMPDVYRALEDSKDTNSAYSLLTGEATPFPPGKTLGHQNIYDGAASTLLVVEAKRDIPWTKPEDLSYETDKPLPELGGFDPDGFCAIFVNTSTRFIERSKFDDATIRAWITPAGKEKVRRPD